MNTRKPYYSKTFTGVLTAPDGTRRHFINGAYGRADGGACVEYPDGTLAWYIENPKRGGFGQRDSLEHRVGGPALIRPNGDRLWYEMGKLTLIEFASGTRKIFDKGVFVREEKPASASAEETMEQQAPTDRLQILRDRVSHLAHAYYVLDAPEVSDGEYDALHRELERLEAAHPESVTPV